jgi:hypothetical protein
MLIYELQIFQRSLFSNDHLEDTTRFEAPFQTTNCLHFNLLNILNLKTYLNIQKWFKYNLK